MDSEIKINRCQVCGEGLPHLEVAGGFKFICLSCGAQTERCRGFDEAIKRWNEVELHNDGQ